MKVMLSSRGDLIIGAFHPVVREFNRIVISYGGGATRIAAACIFREADEG
jgi:hypothetical protein